MKPALILLAGLAAAPAAAQDIPPAGGARMAAVLPRVLPPEAGTPGLRLRHIPQPAPDAPRPPRRGEAAPAVAAVETGVAAADPAPARDRPLPRPAAVTDRALAAAAPVPLTLDEMMRAAFVPSRPWIVPEDTGRILSPDGTMALSAGPFSLPDAGKPSFTLAAALLPTPAPAAAVSIRPVAFADAIEGITDPVARDLLARYADVIPSDADEARLRVGELMKMDAESLEMMDAVGSVVQVSDEEYRSEIDPAVAAAATPGSALAVLLQTGKGRSIVRRLAPRQVAALGQLQPAQVTAATMAGMVQGVPRPAPATMAMAPALLEGIPSLDYRGPAPAGMVPPSPDMLPAPVVISAADVPAGSAPFSPPATEAGMAPAMMMAAAEPAPPVVQAPVVAGDGTNLLLSGWKVGLTGTGTIGMFRERDPGSVIELDADMVVGALGRVRDFGFEDEQIVVTFESGEEITGPISTMNFGGQG